MATLHFLIGLPGSGKSTFAKKIAKDNFAVILSSDNIRKELFGYENQDNNGKVFEVMNNRAIELLENNIDVVYDATNLNEKKRRTIISRAKNVESKIVAYLCCTQIDKILERKWYKMYNEMKKVYYFFKYHFLKIRYNNIIKEVDKLKIMDDDQTINEIIVNKK